jgi:carbonic anhydrase/acetyltransferase-like protein (isoleucine patch superfamily)
MVGDDWRWCPRCGEALDRVRRGGAPRPRCRACGFVFFANMGVGAAVVIRDGAGHVLLVRRGPRQFGAGRWCFPCGFVEWGEDVREAAAREALEEAGVVVRLGAVVQVVIRGDVNYIRIGDRTNVQDGTVVHVQHDTHPTVVGNDVTIGHGAVVHGCTIHDRVLVGMGAILLNGVEIGEDSIVAAGTLVTERTVIPPRSMVMGSPGRVRRPLTGAEVAMILEFSGNYVGYRLDYMG